MFKFFKQLWCSHEFKGRDLQPRTVDGMVTWKCCKCEKVFVATNGLKILEHGRCVGEWF